MRFVDDSSRRRSAIVAHHDGYWRWWDGSLVPYAASPSHPLPLVLASVLESVAFSSFSLSLLSLREGRRRQEGRRHESGGT